MEKKFIGAGLLSGLIAGIFAYVFARIFTEPVVAKAIDYESGRSEAEEALEHAAGGGRSHGEGGELFTRSVQENIGAGTGTLIFALCMGAFFAVAFTVLWTYVGRRYPATDPRALAGALGLISFVALWGTPYFVYPANPPAVGNDDTIGDRSGAYLTLTLVSVILMILAVWAFFVLRPRLGGIWSAVVGGAGYLIGVTITAALLPTFDEVPTAVVNADNVIVFPGFPGDVIGDFRVYTIATQVILWTVLITVFSLILGRLTKPVVDAAALDERIVARQD